MSILLPEAANPPPVEGVDYEFIESDEHALKIKLLSHGWEGVVYVYDHVALNAPNQNSEVVDEFDDIDAKYNLVEEAPEDVVLKFNYQILDNPNKCVTRSHPPFEIWLGEILSAILVDATTNEKTKYSMFSKTDEGKIESLQPPKKSITNLSPPQIKTVSVWGRVKNFFTGNR